MAIKNFILTGTTGAGKTTIIRRLEELGQRVVHESFMEVYRRLKAAGVENPLGEPSFIDEIVALQVRREAESRARNAGLVYCDRSPFCTLALSKFMGRETSPALMREIERIQRDAVYAQEVLFIQNLGYAPGNEVAKLSYTDLVAFEATHREVYVTNGYRCIDIPPLAVDERVRLILAHYDPEASFIGA